MLNIQEIKDLIKFVGKAGVKEVSLEKDDFKITIKSEGEGSIPQVVHTPVVSAAPAAPAPAPAAAPQAAPTAKGGDTSKGSVDESKLVAIKSPMIGTFYRSSNPESDAFVNVGDVVKAGDVVCIVEAMKLFNEIESEISGKIVKILVDNASPVEYDQPLFLVDPS